MYKIPEIISAHLFNFSNFLRRKGYINTSLVLLHILKYIKYTHLQSIINIAELLGDKEKYIIALKILNNELTKEIPYESIFHLKLMKSHILFKSGNIVEAIELSNQLINNDLLTNTKPSAVCIGNLIEYYTRSKNYELAINLIKQFVRSKEYSYSGIYYNSGNLFQKLKLYQTSIHYYQKAHKLSQEDYHITDNMAFSFFQLKKYKKAMHFFEYSKKYIKQSYDLGRNQYSIAGVYWVQRDYKNALKSAYSALELGYLKAKEGIPELEALDIINR